MSADRLSRRCKLNLVQQFDWWRNSEADRKIKLLPSAIDRATLSHWVGDLRDMNKLPSILCAGEPSRLFPILADTSKEGRTLSIFLACLENIPEFGRALLGGLGVRLGTRSRVDTFTEVGLQKNLSDAKHRPDGLILVNIGKVSWTALVEAKVGNSDLTNPQIEAYLALAKLNGIDAVITVSNQFTPIPTHHPLTVNSSLTKKVSLFHWSWAYVITQAQLLREMGEVEDREQLILLSELQRFLLHDSSGVKEFSQMPAAWPELCAMVSAGGEVKVRSEASQEVVGCWHQALDQVTTVLCRQLANHVKVVMSRSEASDPQLRLKNALTDLAKDKCLNSQIVIPDTAAPVQICADISKRVLTFQMRLRAPTDRKSTKARLSWLLRQIADADPKDIHVRLLWPGRSSATLFPLADLRARPEIASNDKDGMAVSSFELLLVKDLGGKFTQRKNFVTELVSGASDFHVSIGANLTNWQAKPPKISDERLEPTSVGADALRDQIEQEALERSG